MGDWLDGGNRSWFILRDLFFSRVSAMLLKGSAVLEEWKSLDTLSKNKLGSKCSNNFK